MTGTVWKRRRRRWRRRRHLSVALTDASVLSPSAPLGGTSIQISFISTLSANKRARNVMNQWETRWPRALIGWLGWAEAFNAAWEWGERKTCYNRFCTRPTSSVILEAQKSNKTNIYLVLINVSWERESWDFKLNVTRTGKVNTHTSCLTGSRGPRKTHKYGSSLVKEPERPGQGGSGTIKYLINLIC